MAQVMAGITGIMVRVTGIVAGDMATDENRLKIFPRSWFDGTKAVDCRSSAARPFATHDKETLMNMTRHASFVRAIACALLAFAAIGSANAQLIEKKTLSVESAEKVIAAAKAEAKANNWRMVIAVVDDGGHLIALQRMDGAQLGSLEVAPGKAKTALNFLRPTKFWEEVAKTRPAVLTISPSAVLLEGGIPIVYQGQVIGAVGVSGATSQQDAQVAEAGVRALGFEAK